MTAAPLAGTPDRATMLRLANAWQTAVAVEDWGGAAALTSASCTLEIAGTTPLSGVAPFDIDRLRATLAGGVGWSRIACADYNGAVLLMRSADPAYAQDYGVVIEGDAVGIGRISLFWNTAAGEAHLYKNPLLPEPTRSIMPDFDLRLAFANRFSGGP